MPIFNPSAGGGIPGGSDTNMQFNDSSAFGGANVNYNKTTHRTGFDVAASPTLATVHADGSITGDTLVAPASLSYVLTLDTQINSPSTASVTQVNSPTDPTSLTLGFTYIDPPYDAGQFTTQNGAETGYTANGNTISYSVFAYRLVGGVYVTHPVPFVLTTFTDNTNGLPYGVDIGGWTTTNGYQDGYLLVVQASEYGNVPYAVNIGNVTSYSDLGVGSGSFGNQVKTDSAYQSNGGNATTAVASYKNISGTKYRSAYTTNPTSDGNNSLYYIVNATWSSAVDDGFIARTISGQFYDTSTVNSFDDYGQSVGSIGDYSTFFSIAFPYFNTSIVDSSAVSATFNYGSGGQIADGSNWDVYVYEYRANVVDGKKYMTSTPAIFNLGIDANDSSPFTVSGSFTPGDGSGQFVVLYKNGVAVAGIEGSSGAFSGLDVQTTPNLSNILSSYTGMSWSWSDYGYIISPSTKYSASANSYANVDTNPVNGFIWLHQQATFGNANHLKIIENAPRTPGSFYVDVTAASIYQFYTALGDTTVTPATIGYPAAGQTVVYRVYSNKTVNGVSIYSSTYATTSVLFPNNGLFYVVDLTSATVSGAAYKFQRIPTIVGTGYEVSTNTLQDNTTLGWAAAGTLDPTVAYGNTGIFDWNSSTLATTYSPLLIRDKYVRGGFTDAWMEFQYNTGSAYASAARFGHTSLANAAIKSLTGGLEIGTLGTVNTVISGSSGTIFNAQGSSSSGQNFTIKSQAYASGLMFVSAPQSTVYFGSTTFTAGDPQSLIAIKDGGTDKAIVIESSNATSNGILFGVLNTSGTLLQGITRSGRGFFGTNSNNNAILQIGAGDATYSSLVLMNSTTLPTTPNVGGIEYSANSPATVGAFYGSIQSNIRKRFQMDLGSGTANSFWYSDANGYATTSGNPIVINGAGNILTFAQASIFSLGAAINGTGGLTFGSTSNLNLTNVPVIGAARWSYVAKTANYTITNAEYLVNATANSFNFTLPTAVSISGRGVYLHNSGSGTETINTTSAQTINGQASGAITLTQNKGIWVFSDGANYISPGVLATAIVGPIAGSQITGAALTKTDDTNVTLTLGGSPTTALVNATSLTLGWTGLLAEARGGTGVAKLILFDHFVDANNGTTVETDLYTDTLVAGQFSANGQKVTAQYQIVCTGAALASQDLRVYFGGTSIYDSGALSLGAITANFTFYITIIRVSSSVVRCAVSVSSDFATLFPYSKYTEVTGLTLSNTQILKITGQAAGAGGASNQITAKEGYVQFLPSA